MTNQAAQPKYRALVDKTTKDEWDNLLREFDDANIFQTWSYGSARWGRKVSRCVIYDGKEPVALAQLVVARLPLVQRGVAYLLRGPVWRSTKKDKNLEIFSEILRALQYEYSKKRRLLLRVALNDTNQDGEELCRILKEEGFAESKDDYQDSTILIDLTPPVEELKKGLRRKWRQSLGYSERHDLNIVSGKEVQLYDVALQIYREMHNRKKFSEFVDMNTFRVMQEDLPEHQKINISVGYCDEKPVAALAWTTLGKTGLPLLAATGNGALTTNAAYRLWWEMVVHMKVSGCTTCDVGGVSKERNPGGYTFKSGLAGKNGREVEFIVPYDVCRDHASLLLSRLAGTMKNGTKRAKRFWTKAKALSARRQAALRAADKGGQNQQNSGGSDGLR